MVKDKQVLVLAFRSI